MPEHDPNRDGDLDAEGRPARIARLTSSLTAEERAQIAAAHMPTKAEQRRFLAEMAAAMKASKNRIFWQRSGS